MSEARADLPPAQSAMGLAPAPPAPSAPSAPSGGDTVVGSTPTAPPSLRDQIKQRWIAAGATPQGAEGIVQAVEGESGLDPTRVGDNGTSFGIYQHHNDRAVRLLDYAKSQNKSPSDPMVQTDFAIREATSGGDPMATQHRDSFMKATDSAVGKAAFSGYFERPASLRDMMFTPGSGSATRQRMEAFDQDVSRQAERDRAEYERISRETDPGSKERSELMAEARQRAAHYREVYEDFAKRPPAEKPIDALQNFGSIGTMLALLIGGMGRHHMNGALAAAGAMMQAAQANNHELFERQYKLWDHQSGMALNLAHLESDEVRNLLEDKRMSENERQAKLTAFYQEHNMTYQAQQMRAGMMERAMEADQRAEIARNSAANQKLQFGQMMFQNWLQSDEGRKATPDQVDAKAALYGVVSGKGGSQPRNAPAMFMQEWQKEHPGATATELAEAMGEYRRIQSIEGGFANGLSGRQVVSLNTVADHILRVEDYANALNNGQIPRANAIANAIAKNLGKPEVTTFEAGRTIMADEVVRLLTSTGGSREDREGMQKILATMSSPEQFAGLFQAFKDFTGARFEALRQEYSQGDPEREKRFDTKLLTEKGRKVFESLSSTSGGAGGSDAGLPKIDNQESYDKLPSGAHFVAPNGQEHVKP